MLFVQVIVEYVNANCSFVSQFVQEFESVREASRIESDFCSAEVLNLATYMRIWSAATKPTTSAIS
jgi:hypothetical protein